MPLIKKSSVEHSGTIISGKVSVIITNYRKEPFLRRAILSCLNQSYEDIEIIVVDDCSNVKKSLSIARDVGSDKVRYLYTSRNYGHYACCNYAMDQATGKYITFLGGDDTIAKDHVRHLLIALEKHKLAAACCQYARYDKSGKRIGKSDRICEASIFFKKNTFIKDIGYFHMVRYAADTEYRMRAIEYYGGNKFGVLKSSSYKALYLPGSLTSDKKTGSGSSGRSGYAKQFIRGLKANKPDSLYFNYKTGSLKYSLEKEIRVDNFDPKTFKEIAL
jgi:glycosyltransferase involved in cell wall biosynthesis